MIEETPILGHVLLIHSLSRFCPTYDQVTFLGWDLPALVPTGMRVRGEKVLYIEKARFVYRGCWFAGRVLPLESGTPLWYTQAGETVKLDPYIYEE